MLISIVNLPRGAVADEDLQRDWRDQPADRRGLRALLELRRAPAPRRLRRGVRPRQKTLPEMRGDALTYLWDQMGYHDCNDNGIPFGIVWLNECR